ncbi:MAG: primosomal protein N' [Thiofilum sp.]|uniref:primosomal protein N' n=1 Tax=Thiofilum sp. TaxID=2212733 RepID=UPI0025CF9A47|nr:primosomal protein N' [Thiofilum sp.]MBK8453078.1 primosomal protein N' [Thiofilum sp.]
MNTLPPVVHVAVQRPFYSTLDYSYDPQQGSIPIGSRIEVKLTGRSTVGLVMGSSATPTLADPKKLKAISRVMDDEPILDAHLVELLDWAAKYYHEPIGEVVFTALPTLLRQNRPLHLPIWWQLHTTDTAPTELQRAKRQLALYEWLKAQGGYVSEEAVAAWAGNGWRVIMRQLEAKGLVSSTTLPPPPLDHIATAPHLTLTPQQLATIEGMQQALNQTELKPVLLHGITGSGKTEVYLRVMAPILAQGRQVLVLVPEISLTPQLLERFRVHYPHERMVCLHSGMSDQERLQAWLQARQQQVRIIIGTRSAVFTPCPHLGLIIIDEEHDLSFKQQEGFRYHGRDLAIKRAQMLNIPIILGSATPALETLHNADSGRFHYFHLGQRPGTAKPPSVQLQTIRGQTLRSGLSTTTLAMIKDTLARQEQVMLFINRRGFAPLLMCPSCGWSGQCEYCSANMTYHARQGKLICHHCSVEKLVPEQCPHCGHPQLLTQGQGTERLELVLEQTFPTIPIIRIDRDSTSRKGALAERLQQVHDHQTAILVGTQMLAKGHDFPNLTLVVVLEADAALLSSEYHARERFGQLLVQVAGRAGRSDKAGQVIIQTQHPENPALVTLLEQGYTLFARQLLEERRRWHYPPFGYQALLRANAPELNEALEALEKIAEHLQLFGLGGVMLLGPTTAMLEKRAGRYRTQLLLQSSQRKALHTLLNYLTRTTKQLKFPANVRWSIDVDPLDLT